MSKIWIVSYPSVWGRECAKTTSYERALDEQRGLTSDGFKFVTIKQSTQRALDGSGIPASNIRDLDR